MASTSSTKYNLKPLRGSEDYTLWSFSAKAILIENGGWDAIQPPEQPTEIEASSASRGKAKTKEKERSPAEEQMPTPSRKAENTAQSFIIQHVHDSLKPLIMKCTTAREMWEKLAVLCQTHQTSTIRLRKELYMIDYDCGKPMLDYICKVENHVARLAGAGEMISVKEHVAVLLSGLGNFLEGTRQSLEVLPDDKLTLDYVTACLLREGVKTYSPQEEEHANAVSIKNAKACRHCDKTNHTSSQCFTLKDCHICGKKGHIARFCPDNKTKDKDNKDQDKGKDKGKSKAHAFLVDINDPDCDYSDCDYGLEYGTPF